MKLDDSDSRRVPILSPQGVFFHIILRAILTPGCLPTILSIQDDALPTIVYRVTGSRALANSFLEGYEDLYKWSVENICEFWAELWDFLEIIYSRRFDTVVDLNVPMSDLPKWFEGAKLNHAENLLKYRDDRLALIVD
ncbi:acetoacetyl-CoA synthetase, partial [Nephila pilipes]